MRLTRINGESWLVGLQWYVPPMQATIPDIKKYVENEQCDCIVKRGIQIGYGSSDGNDSLVGKRSLAARISTPVNIFVGIFNLVDEITDEPFWWLFARINGNNMSGFGDAVFDNLEETERALDELRDLLPPNAEIDEEIKCLNERESLNWLRPHCEISFLSKLSGQYVVKRLSAFKGRKSDISRRLLLGFTFLGFLGAGFYYGYDYLTYLGLTSKAQQQAAEIQRKRMEYETNPTKLFPEIWKSYPNAASVSQKCLSMMQDINLNYAGWNLDELQCAMGNKSGNLIIQYKHTPLAAYRYIPEDATFQKDSAKSSQDIKEFRIKKALPWDMGSTNEPDYKKLPKQEQIRKLFLEIAQNYGAKISLGFAPYEQKSIDDLGTFRCPWAKGTFSIQNLKAVQVSGICELLGKIPALAITRIEFDLKQWTIKGEMYAL